LFTFVIFNKLRDTQSKTDLSHNQRRDENANRGNRVVNFTYVVFYLRRH